LSSDTEPALQSPLPPPSPPQKLSQVSPERLRHPTHVEENLDLPNPSTPPQDSPSPPFQSPPVSSHEVEDMMNISSSPTKPATSSYPFEPVEDSEQEEEVTMEDTHEADDLQGTSASPVEDSIIQSAQSGDELPSLPPPSSSSPSCHIQISRGPTPIVRYLLYGGPNGIFRDANISLQKMQARSSQDIPSNSHISGPVHAAGTPSVSNTFLSFFTTL
jgi:hypothetical protein